jgi:hypothetical protein
MPFKQLKITKQEIIEKFIIEGILPKNFNNLKLKENASEFPSKWKSDVDIKSGELHGRRTIEVFSETR